MPTTTHPAFSSTNPHHRPPHDGTPEPFENQAIGLLCRVVAVSSGWVGDSGDDRGGGSGGSRPLADDEALIPPSVAFNAGLGPYSDNVILRWASNNGGNSSGGGHSKHGTVLLHSPPPIACAASVSRVKRPRPTGAPSGGGSTARRAKAHALALTSFFSAPRVLRVGDVFGVSIPRPGGTTSGCWWQELQENDDDDLDFEEGKDPPRPDEGGWGGAEEAVTAVAAPAGSVRCEESPERSAASDWVTARLGDGLGGIVDGGSSDRRQPARPPPPRRRRESAAQRFRAAIVRQGSELVFFRVTELRGAGTRGAGGGSSSEEASLGLAAGNDERLEQEGSLETEEAAGGMVVSQRVTELREGGPVCSPVPETLRYQRFVCRANGYPCPEAKPPFVSSAAVAGGGHV